MGCDLISRTEKIHRWLFKCPTGQLFASFLTYGLPARPPIIYPSQVLRAVILGFCALNMGIQLLPFSVLRSTTSNYSPRSSSASLVYLSNSELVPIPSSHCLSPIRTSPGSIVYWSAPPLSTLLHVTEGCDFCHEVICCSDILTLSLDGPTKPVPCRPLRLLRVFRSPLISHAPNNCDPSGLQSQL